MGGIFQVVELHEGESSTNELLCFVSLPTLPLTKAATAWPWRNTSVLAVHRVTLAETSLVLVVTAHLHLHVHVHVHFIVPLPRCLNQDLFGLTCC